MIHIKKKRREPNAWLRYRLTKGVEFSAIPELKDSLLTEQGYLCAYCMARIDKDHMKVEHFKPRSRYPRLKFSYKNLLACCLGKTQEESHCDTSKGNDEIRLSPLSPSWVDTLSYESGTGAIRSSNPYYNRELDRILHLNTPIIKENRLKVLQGAIQALRSVGGNSGDIRRQLEQKWDPVDKEGKRKPYCGIVIYFLEKKLGRKV